MVHWGNTQCVDRQGDDGTDTETCDPTKITCPACRNIHDKAVEKAFSFEPWTDRPRTEPKMIPVAHWDTRAVLPYDPVVIADSDIEFHVLVRCVHELNKLNAVDKAAASRVTDYLFNRYTGK